MKKTIIILLSSVFLSSCAGAAVGWGGTHKVLHKDNDVITIQYDSLVESYDDIMVVAYAHCEQSSKRPVVSNVQESSSSMGLVKTTTV
jgi:hypothetical protein